MVMFFPVGVNFKKSGGGGTLGDVVLLINGDALADSSPNPKSITNTGEVEAEIYNEPSKFGNGSIFFDIARLTTGSSPDLVLGANDFTVEAWIYGLSNSGYSAIAIFGDYNTGLYINYSDQFRGGVMYFEDKLVEENGIFVRSGEWLVSGGELIISETWNHLAVTRSGNLISLFLNGLLGGTAEANTSYTADNYVIGDQRPDDPNTGIGEGSSSPYAYYGHMERVRVTKGVARYTANFNPETDTYL